MVPVRYTSRRAALRISTSMLALTLASGAAYAQSTYIGAVDVQAGRGGLPISAPNAVGSQAPAGSAPALAPAQGSLESFQPGSIISDKVIRDMIPPSSDYNETAKYTPGFLSNNSNGLLGDSKGGCAASPTGSSTSPSMVSRSVTPTIPPTTRRPISRLPSSAV